jgi:hypothetical protein
MKVGSRPVTEDPALVEDEAALQRLGAAVLALSPTPRARRWVSLSFCILDAVWSIGALYDEVVVPLVRSFAGEFGVDAPTIPASEPPPADPIPLAELTDFDAESLAQKTNRQRTSTRGGILKADAVLRHVHVFRAHGVDTLADATTLLEGDDRFREVDQALRVIPGEGSDMVRRGYLWMLIGNDDLIKPDRMVLRWLRHQGVNVSADEARELIAALAPILSERCSRRVTPWEIDHALWKAGKSLARR